MMPSMESRIAVVRVAQDSYRARCDVKRHNEVSQCLHLWIGQIVHQCQQNLIGLTKDRWREKHRADTDMLSQ